MNYSSISKVACTKPYAATCNVCTVVRTCFGTIFLRIIMNNQEVDQVLQRSGVAVDFTLVRQDGHFIKPLPF